MKFQRIIYTRILEQFMGKWCANVYCVDSPLKFIGPSKLSKFFIGEVSSNVAYACRLCLFLGLKIDTVRSCVISVLLP